MDIECKLKREGGSHVPIDNVTYHFVPLPDGAHVAAVASEAHQDRFLGIPEAYRVYRGKEQPASTPVVTKTYSDGVKATGPGPLPDLSPAILPISGAHVGGPLLLGSSVHPASFDIHGKTWSLGDVVALTHRESGLDAAEWNELAEETRADLIDEQLDRLNADLNGDGVVDQSEERAALAAKYKDKFGKAPHHKWAAAKIREALDAQ
jgi:hypothetical protein